jgi:hypothetical protein
MRRIFPPIRQCDNLHNPGNLVQPRPEDRIADVSGGLTPRVEGRVEGHHHPRRQCRIGQQQIDDARQFHLRRANERNQLREDARSARQFFPIDQVGEVSPQASSIRSRSAHSAPA